MAEAGRRPRRLLVLAVPVVFLLASAGICAASPDLYSATVIVTGRDNLAERARGIREALPKVLTKLTVDEALAERAVAQGFAEKAEALVERFDYVDRKEGIQISDEQGTRERSFELTVRFDPVKIDAIVEKLGGSVWAGERPQIGVALLIDDGTSTYLLTRSSERGWGQRLAFEDEAGALALTVSLPEAAPAGEAINAGPDGAGLDKVRLDTPVRLEGRMTITPQGYWNTAWRLRGDGLDRRFSLADTTFDVAIGEALRRSAKALAKR